jgi:imidazolonepropionase-like amidohydrolase
MVLAGTDAGQGPHGTLIEQIGLLVDAGMPVTSAIGAVSWTARRYLGLPCLEPGAPADLVVYDADPRRDLDVLRRPALIVLNGQPIRPPTVPMRH